MGRDPARQRRRGRPFERAAAARLLAILSALAMLACPGGEDPDPAPLPPAGPPADGVAVDVVDATHAVVVDADGGIHTSRDAGRTWRRAEAPAGLALSAVAMGDAEVGWAVGDDAILVTRDGGERWLRQPIAGAVGEGVRLHGVAAIDRDRAIAVGDGGIRLRTADGGGRWEVVGDGAEPGSGAGLEAVACVATPAARCWAVGGVVSRSDDAGVTWRRVEPEGPPLPDPVPFAPWAVEVDASGADELARLVAGWERGAEIEWRLEPWIGRVEREAVPAQRDPEAVFSVVDARLDEVRSHLERAGVPSERIVLHGAPPWDYGDYLDDDPHVLDRYWAERAAPSSGIGLRPMSAARWVALDLDARGAGWAVGRWGGLLRLDDDGARWRFTAPRPASAASAVEAAPDVADPASEAGPVAAGERRDSRDAIRDVAALGEGALVVGSAGIWLASGESEPGGPSTPGSTSASSTDADGRAIAFSPDEALGLAIGPEGRVWRSLDGGRRWEAVDMSSQARQAVVR